VSFQQNGDTFEIPLASNGPTGSGAASNYPTEDLTGKTDPGIGNLVIADRIKHGILSVDLTLPNVEGDNCTLQLIQMMTDKPPYATATTSDDIYFACVDLVLSATAPPPDAGPIAAPTWARAAAARRAAAAPLEAPRRSLCSRRLALAVATRVLQLKLVLSQGCMQKATLESCDTQLNPNSVSHRPCRRGISILPRLGYRHARGRFAVQSDGSDSPTATGVEAVSRSIGDVDATKF
jgi:hypothetical protein